MVNGILGEKVRIIYGVPQISVLGPIFFILCMNRIRNLKIDGKIITYYADDTCMIFVGPTWNQIHLEKGLKKFMDCLST